LADAAIVTDDFKPYPPLRAAFLVWSLGALFYLIGFYQRVAPAVITTELMAGFGIGAAGLGHLSAFYYYAYVAMQIPTGVLADRVGPRLLLTVGTTAAAVGTLIFAASASVWLAGFGRLLVGGSVAVAWVALLKITGHWFSPRRFATLSGLALLAGVLGATTAGAPLRLLVNAFGWRLVMALTGLVTAALAAAIWIYVRDDPTEKGYQSHAPRAALRSSAGPSVLAGLKEIAAYRNTWLLFLAPGGIVGPILTFAGLWGVPFLTVRFGLNQTAAAAICSALMIAWAGSSPFLGALSDRTGRRKTLYLAGCLIATAGWASIIFVGALPLWLFVAVLLITGTASGTMILTFAYGKESVPPHLTGTINGTCNMGVMIGPTILQPVVGLILDHYWTGDLVAGARVYDLAAYRAGFSVMLAWTAAACVLIALTKETHCRQLEA
jgi:MFS family permease